MDGQFVSKHFYTKKTTFTDEDEWVEIPGGVPAIVSEEIWEQANHILNERRKKKIESDNDGSEYMRELIERKHRNKGGENTENFTNVSA